MRTPVSKTPKCFIGGAFVRSESGRVEAFPAAGGSFPCHVPLCSRKDLRNAVEAAVKAAPGWTARGAGERGGILYRLAELLESRAAELAQAIGGAEAADEVSAAVDRCVHYAGWTDKLHLLSGVGGAAGGVFFQAAHPVPGGVAGVVAPDAAPLLGLLSLALPALAAGNAVVALGSWENPLPALLLGEILASGDLSGGVFNLLSGKRAELLPVFASHGAIRCLSAAADAEERKTLRLESAQTGKHLHFIHTESNLDWFSESQQGLEALRPHLAGRNLWHPAKG